MSIYTCNTMLANDNYAQARLCAIQEDDHYSSLRFYQDRTNNFGMLKYFHNDCVHVYLLVRKWMPLIKMTKVFDFIIQ